MKKLLLLSSIALFLVINVGCAGHQYHVKTVKYVKHCEPIEEDSELRVVLSLRKTGQGVIIGTGPFIGYALICDVIYKNIGLYRKTYNLEVSGQLGPEDEAPEDAPFLLGQKIYVVENGQKTMRKLV